ncbi:hypothetical protein Hanom_Chr08g00739121 [Helianthus anomalus]
MRCEFYKFSLIPGVVVLLTTTYLFMCLFLFFFHLFSSCVLIYVFPEAYVLVMVFFEPVVSLEAASLSHGIEVRLAYILPSPDPINSFAIGRIILVVVVVATWKCIQGSPKFFLD